MTPTPSWPAPTAVPAHVHGTVVIPGSKSLTNRSLVLAALAAQPTVIRGTLMARDTRLMIGGLQSMGVGVTVEDSTVTVMPQPLTGSVRVDCGLAGTVMRFLPPVAALARGDVAFDGDPRARQRPMAPLLAALRQLGVPVAGAELPIIISGRGAVSGRAATIDAATSSQFVSGLLLAGARFDDGLDLRHRGGPLPSLPHVRMTTDLLADRGVRVTADTEDATDCRWQVAPGPIAGGDVTIEPDLSNAGPFLAAAMVTGGQVRIPHWPADTTQAGDELRAIFAAMGGTAELTAAGLTLRGPDSIRALSADLSAVGELLPTVAAVAAFADGPSRLTGLAHVRGHETDRLHALATELGRLGAQVTELPDGLVITPGPMSGAVVQCYDDHRMATFAAIVGLRVPGVALSDVGTTAKTMPDFPQLWTELVRPGVGVDP